MAGLVCARLPHKGPFSYNINAARYFNKFAFYRIRMDDKSTKSIIADISGYTGGIIIHMHNVKICRT